MSQRRNARSDNDRREEQGHRPEPVIAAIAPHVLRWGVSGGVHIELLRDQQMRGGHHRVSQAAQPKIECAKNSGHFPAMPSTPYSQEPATTSISCSSGWSSCCSHGGAESACQPSTSLKTKNFTDDYPSSIHFYYTHKI